MKTKMTPNMVLRQMPWHANMTEENHLKRALLAKPDEVGSLVTRAFSSYMNSDNPLTANLIGTGREEYIDGTQWTYKIMGAPTRPLVIMENVMDAEVTQPGKHRTSFKLKFDENHWKKGDIVHPGTSNKKYQVRLQSDGQKHGKGWVYEGKLVVTDDSLYLPLKYLQANQKWGKLYSKYGEAAESAGSTQYSLPMEMTSFMSRMRKEFSVTGDADQSALVMAIQAEDGSVHTSWTRYAEKEFWRQWYREVELSLWTSYYSETIGGDNGRPVKSGPGVDEYLEKAPKHYYNKLSVRLIEEFLMDMVYSKNSPGSGNRKLKAYTGEYGMIEFNRAVEDHLAKKGFLQVIDNKYVQGVKTPYHSNGLSAGYQYVTYKMANGLEIELIHNPIYDDRTVNFEIDPATGFPVESRKITFLDFAGEGTESNIKIVKRRGAFKLGYVDGLQTHLGPASGTSGAHTGDYWEMTVQDDIGLHIADVSRCGQLIPQVAA